MRSGSNVRNFHQFSRVRQQNFVCEISRILMVSDVFPDARGDIATPFYTVDPLKNHPTDAFYFFTGSSRHQSLKDKCASSLPLTTGICRRFFLLRPPGHFIILSNFHHFIHQTKISRSFSLLLPLPVEIHPTPPVAKLLSALNRWLNSSAAQKTSVTKAALNWNISGAPIKLPLEIAGQVLYKVIKSVTSTILWRLINRDASNILIRLYMKNTGKNESAYRRTEEKINSTEA